MKKILSIILCITLMLTALPLGAFDLTASAATDGYYTYTVTGGKATITDVNTSISGDIVIPNTLGGYSVTKIGDEAFQSCRKITGVTIPNTVTTIGEYAFYNCTAMIYVDVPNSITSMGSNAFNVCSSLEIVYMQDLAAWCNIDFSGYPSNPLSSAEYIIIDNTLIFDLEIPNTVTTIKTCAFIKCAAIESVTIPSSVTTIESSAFAKCPELRSVKFSEGITSIGTYAFEDCTSLTSVTIPESVNAIESSTFRGCTSLSKLHITDRLTSIGWYAFNNCNSLNSVYFLGDDKTSVSINSAGNESVINATWYCTCRNHLYDNDCDTICNRCEKTRITIHTYSNNCDSSCNICGFVRTVPDHIYTNTCDIACNECGLVRTTTHTYDNACDEVCNVCAKTRTITHSYVNNCAVTCNICGYERVPFEHVYSSACDADCNVCGFIRTVPDHIYSNDCDATCNICGYERVPSDHIYSEVCDTDCNVCGYIRTAANHTYRNDCDITCDVCGYERVPFEHVYSSACDADCNVCGFIRTVTDHIYNNACDATCNLCEQSRIAPHYFEWVVDKNSNCVESGTKHQECKVCHIKQNENTVIDATDEHTFAWVVDKNSTCGESGTKHQECKVCHIKQNENTVIDATGNHIFEWIIDKANNCGINGLKHEECRVCHIKRNENTKISATGKHSYDSVCDAVCNVCEYVRTAPHNYEWVVDKANNCGVDGARHEECSVCHIKRNENSKIPAVGEHTFTDDNDMECDVCKQKFLLIRFDSNGGIEVNQIRATVNKSVVLPSVVPSKSGYNFVGWSTSKHGDAQYQAGDVLPASNTSLILYAQWDKLCDPYAYRNCYYCSGTGDEYYYSTKCSACNGTGKDECYWCDATGLGYTCYSCSGTGNKDGTCSNCNGKGEVYGQAKCLSCSSAMGMYVSASSFCRSQGHLISTPVYSCSTCSGDGKVLKECTSCEGTGKTDCYWCDGTGKEECDTCNGSGNKKVYRNCSECSGSGKTKITCSICKKTGIVIRTDVSAPLAPIVESVTSSTVVLKTIENGEYSLDGITWQESPEFYNLVEGKEYTFYQRYAKTDFTLRSEASAPIKILVHNHIFDNACDTNCDLCDYERTITHDYKTAWDKDDLNHWYECNVCNDKTNVEAHDYDNACDTECSICGQTRTVPEHSYTLNSNYTCDICKYSKTPAKPIVENKTNSSVTLVLTDGFEYSKDGITWQDSNVFNDLLPNTTYTFYQRVKASLTALVSGISEGLTVTFKSAQELVLPAPVISSFTDVTVTLIPNANCEYSLDGVNWQQSNVFEGLLSGTKYTFYQRYAETDVYEAGNKSLGTSITTDKSKQLLVPNAPIVESFTSSSITLVAVDGCEYSKNGTTWQSSNVFNYLACGTEYTFYQRYKETDTTYAGKISVALVTKTDKGTQTAPPAPMLESKTHNTVTLRAKSGYEYSRDGINWQSSNVFDGLNAETNYMFYCRKAETETHYASESSKYLIVKTNEQPTYTPGDINDSGDVTLDDVVVLAQFIAGWQGVAYNEAALDVNRDGSVTLDDVVLLAQFVAGWNVTLS